MASDAQTLELLSWIASRPRTYRDAMDAWTSNCPRHPAWDDAIGAGLIRIRSAQVTLTDAGRAALEAAAR